MPVDDAACPRQRDRRHALLGRTRQEELEPLDLGLVLLLAAQPLIGQLLGMLLGALVRILGLGDFRLQRLDGLVFFPVVIDQGQNAGVVLEGYRLPCAPSHEAGLDAFHHLFHIGAVEHRILFAPEEAAAGLAGRWAQRARLGLGVSTTSQVQVGCYSASAKSAGVIGRFLLRDGGAGEQVGHDRQSGTLRCRRPRSRLSLAGFRHGADVGSSDWTIGYGKELVRRYDG